MGGCSSGSGNGGVNSGSSVHGWSSIGSSSSERGVGIAMCILNYYSTYGDEGIYLRLLGDYMCISGCTKGGGIGGAARVNIYTRYK